MKERKHIVASAEYWFNNARLAQESGNMSQALGNMEQAYNHTENMLFEAGDLLRRVLIDVEEWDRVKAATVAKVQDHLSKHKAKLGGTV